LSNQDESRVNVESPHGRAGPTLTTISYPTCALTTQKPYSQKAAETVLCCKCWKPIERGWRGDHPACLRRSRIP